MTTEQQERQNMLVLLLCMLGAAGLALLTLNLYPELDWFFVLIAFLAFCAVSTAAAVIAVMIWSWKHRD